jgi:uncharacterized lipoprotein
MNKLIIAVAVLVMAGGASALAQSRNKSNMESSSDSSSRPSVQAPVGHRQPRAGDVPDEKDLGGMNDSISRDDIALDRKLKSICRGC